MNHNNLEAYADGFVKACGSYGVDPEELIKMAQPLPPSNVTNPAPSSKPAPKINIQQERAAARTPNNDGLGFWERAFNSVAGTQNHGALGGPGPIAFNTEDERKRVYNLQNQAAQAQAFRALGGGGRDNGPISHDEIGFARAAGEHLKGLYDRLSFGPAVGIQALKQVRDSIGKWWSGKSPQVYSVRQRNEPAGPVRPLDNSVDAPVAASYSGGAGSSPYATNLDNLDSGFFYV